MSELMTGHEISQPQLSLTWMTPEEFETWVDRFYAADKEGTVLMQALALGGCGGTLWDPYLTDNGIAGEYRNLKTGKQYPGVLELDPEEGDVVVREIVLLDQPEPPVLVVGSAELKANESYLEEFAV